ncbi:transporter substrate-binding domain-containing protein [Sneathiella sp. P13V-1]|uniref:substrate-binding periplasmic protein n=1 Tax=Sneathiella sp. P13V-1 TaxID=2697366 RepID=UPI00187B57B9|nr:transporter substrate-binding domain-containing protein [Sneathiella sp. P13V-1]MBE7636218.1 transporter substrate-binding domain-containing protein [Sneathiella sp. P13V-1]
MLFTLNRLVSSILLGVFLFSSPAVKASDVSSTAYKDYPPFTTDRLPNGGFAIALAKESLKREGLNLKHSWKTWVRGLSEVENSKTDITLPYFYTEEREQIFEYSKPFYSIPTRVYGLKGTVGVVSSVDDLVGKSICNPRGYANPKNLQMLFDEGKATHRDPKNMELCLRLVQAKKVDYFISSPEVTKDTIVKMNIPLDVFEEAGFDVHVNRLHVIISKSNPKAQKIIAAFNAGLDQMASDGSLKAMAEEYGLNTKFVDPLN